MSWFVLLHTRAENSLEVAKLVADDLKCGPCHSTGLARLPVQLLQVRDVPRELGPRAGHHRPPVRGI